MKYYISGVEDMQLVEDVLAVIPRLNYILFTFYKLQNSNKSSFKVYSKILNNCKNMLVDSGAFTLQRNYYKDYDKYVKNYCNFIEKHDVPNISGYFEMDIDNILDYDTICEYRKQLEEVTDKIIPVWHKNRGIQEYKKLCKDYNYIAITNKSADIKKNQMKIFVDYAHKHNTRIHGLGISSKAICDKIPFDSVDSTNYLGIVKYAKYGNNQLNSDYVTNNYKSLRVLGFIEEHKLGEYYYNKWKNYCQWEE